MTITHFVARWYYLMLFSTDIPRITRPALSRAAAAATLDYSNDYCELRNGRKLSYDHYAAQTFRHGILFLIFNLIGNFIRD